MSGISGAAGASGSGSGCGSGSGSASGCNKIGGTVHQLLRASGLAKMSSAVMRICSLLALPLSKHSIHHSQRRRMFDCALRTTSTSQQPVFSRTLQTASAAPGPRRRRWLRGRAAGTAAPQHAAATPRRRPRPASTPASPPARLWWRPARHSVGVVDIVCTSGAGSNCWDSYVQANQCSLLVSWAGMWDLGTGP